MSGTPSLLLLLLVLVSGAVGQSCQGRCGVNDGTGGCQCNSVCSQFGDCCSDYEAVCLSCQERCGEAYVPSKPCQCNSACGSHGNCCPDYDAVCESSTGVTDAELWALTEQLFDAEVNSVWNQLTLDYQGQGQSGDLAPGPFFVSVPESALSGPTIAALRNVQDNYIPSVSQAEDNTEAEVAEQNAFIDAVMNTEIMRLAETFLKTKNLLPGSLRDKLNEIWFTPYQRSARAASSSGFEHVFVGEMKNGVSGFHNWVNFYTEETEGDLNYLSWSKSLTLGDKGEVVVNRFSWMGQTKNIGSMFVGTSPELEMATFTVCFLARRDQSCSVQMAGKQFQVVTYTIYNNNNLLGTAYPDL